VGLRLNRVATAIVLASGAGAGGAVLAAAACIPDLPAGGTAVDAEAGVDRVSPEAAGPRCGDGIVELDAGEQCEPGAGTGDTGSPVCTADCQVVCDGGFVWTRNNHCYTDQGLADDITKASNACPGGAQVHVVTFASEDELGAVAGEFDASAFWVGLWTAGAKYNSLATFEPGWSPFCTGCYAHTADPTQPLPGPADAGCVRGSASTDASWEQFPCTVTKAEAIRVLCEREPSGRQSTVCEAGVCIDLVWTAGSKRYVYVRSSASADDAQQHCQSLGGSLVTLESRDEREQLWKELARLPGGYVTPGAVWIGLSLPDGGNTADPTAWVWSGDASADAYPPEWGGLQPRATGGDRGFLLHSSMVMLPADDTLAHNEVEALLPYVCQLLPGP
jgi:hypothetical protein